jgi:hypothetical protein
LQVLQIQLQILQYQVKQAAIAAGQNFVQGFIDPITGGGTAVDKSVPSYQSTRLAGSVRDRATAPNLVTSSSLSANSIACRHPAMKSTRVSESSSQATSRLSKNESHSYDRFHRIDELNKLQSMRTTWILMAQTMDISWWIKQREKLKSTRNGTRISGAA